MILKIFKIIFLILAIVYYVYIILYEKRSIRSKLIEQSVKLSKYKMIVSNEEIYDKYLERIKLLEEKPFSLPKMKFKNSIKVLEYLGMSYLVINKNNKQKKIFYLPGGSYIENPLFFHYKFFDELATKTDLEIIVPIYPKAPKYDYKISYKKVYKLYCKLFNEKNDVVIMGDSAGGGFALSLSMMIRDNKGVDPSNIILLSPWLDITMKNSDIKRHEKYDPFLSKKAFIKAGYLWANGDNRNKWILSPINGKFNDLGLITIFIGTHEIFISDARKFKKILNRNNIKFNYYEYRNMNHVFPLHPIPEAKDAKAKIIDIIKK